jgi:DNA-binding GntR family transcriptional regulator
MTIPHTPCSGENRRPVQDVLRDLIVSGKLAPGLRLVEMDLCRAFLRSRSPVREAIRILTAEGLIEPNPTRGVQVRHAKAEEIVQTFSVIGTLDAMAGELAAARISPAELASIEERHHRMVAAFQASDQEQYFQCNQAIHRAIWNASGNVILERELERLNAWVRPYRYAVNNYLENWRKSVADHDRILVALINRDGRRLGQILRLHLPSKAQVLRAQLAMSAAREV